MICQSTGPNDAPTTPTFLQVYKILTAYSILKPPKSGNCTILDTSNPKITLNDIKQVFDTDQSIRSIKINELASRLDKIADMGTWEADELLDHDYCQSPVKDCITYYICGYVSRQILKHTKCNSCKLAIQSGKYYCLGSYLNKILIKCITFLPTYLAGNSSIASEAVLTNLKSRGNLIHPNLGFFKLICDLEKSFEKYCNTEHVFQDCVDDFLSQSGHLISFPCLEHRTDILTYIISYYITMRMRQHTALRNRDLKKKSSHLKKQSKLVKH